MDLTKPKPQLRVGVDFLNQPMKSADSHSFLSNRLYHLSIGFPFELFPPDRVVNELEILP